MVPRNTQEQLQRTKITPIAGEPESGRLLSERTFARGVTLPLHDTHPAGDARARIYVRGNAGLKNGDLEERLSAEPICMLAFHLDLERRGE